MKVKIIKNSGSSTCWYANCIGMTFEVILNTRNPCTVVGQYWKYVALEEDSSIKHYIREEDCEIIDDVKEYSDDFYKRIINKMSDMIKNGKPCTPEEYEKLYKELESKYKKKPIIPNENTPVDTLVRVWGNTSSDDGGTYYLAGLDSRGFRVWASGGTSKSKVSQQYFDHAIIIEETLEEKRKRIFHKFVPEQYKWYAVNKDGSTFFYLAQPYIPAGKSFWTSFISVSAGFVDPTDWENSLIGRED